MEAVYPLTTVKSKCGYRGAKRNLQSEKIFIKQ